ncbi:MAG: hypothetical protein WAN14_03160, partial [Candidatus Acidiferrales bacterium]
EKMEAHNRVERCVRQNADGECIFEIQRKGDLPTLMVYLSDAYDYGLGEYLSRPRSLGRGDFILIADPNANFDESVVPRAREDEIGIGNIKKFMGALNFRNVWMYDTPDAKKGRR